MREWRGSTRCSQCVSDKTFLHREKHFGWGWGGDSSGGHYRVQPNGQISHSSGLTGLLEAGLTDPVSHDRKE